MEQGKAAADLLGYLDLKQLASKRMETEASWKPRVTHSTITEFLYNTLDKRSHSHYQVFPYINVKTFH